MAPFLGSAIITPILRRWINTVKSHIVDKSSIRSVGGIGSKPFWCVVNGKADISRILPPEKVEFTKSPDRILLGVFKMIGRISPLRGIVYATLTRRMPWRRGRLCCLFSWFSCPSFLLLHFPLLFFWRCAESLICRRCVLRRMLGGRYPRPSFASSSFPSPLRLVAQSTKALLRM